MMKMSKEINENFKQEKLVNLNDPDKEKIRKIWLNIIKKEALEKSQEDVLMANDEEILVMFPLTLSDYEALLRMSDNEELNLDDEILFWQMQEEIKEAQEDIALCEKSLNDPNIY